jgi:hypothetical protein
VTGAADRTLMAQRTLRYVKSWAGMPVTAHSLSHTVASGLFLESSSCKLHHDFVQVHHAVRSE